MIYTELLRAIPEVESVSYEYPGFWVIHTTKGEFLFGNAGGVYGWHNPEATIGQETLSIKPLQVVSDFQNFLKESHANSN
jgi:hypothetical protein